LYKTKQKSPLQAYGNLVLGMVGLGVVAGAGLATLGVARAAGI